MPRKPATPIVKLQAVEGFEKIDKTDPHGPWNGTMDGFRVGEKDADMKPADETAAVESKTDEEVTTEKDAAKNAKDEAAAVASKTDTEFAAEKTRDEKDAAKNMTDQDNRGAKRALEIPRSWNDAEPVEEANDSPPEMKRLRRGFAKLNLEAPSDDEENGGSSIQAEAVVQGGDGDENEKSEANSFLYFFSLNRREVA